MPVVIKKVIASLTLLVTLAALGAPAPAARAEQKQDEGGRPVASPAEAAEGGAKADTTTTVYPEKMRARPTWEKVVSLPGMIIYLPFWAVFQVTGAVIKIQDRYQIGARLAAIVTTPDGSRGVIPVYSGRSGLGLEFFLKNRPKENARLNLTGSWGPLGRSLYQARARRIALFGEALTVGGQLTFRNMPDEPFFGIGPSSSKEDETNYQLKRATAEIALGRRYTPRFVIGAILGLDHTIPGPGKSDKTPSTTEEFALLPGLRDELTVTRLTLALFYNGANRPVRPTKGWIIETRGRIDQQVNGDKVAYTTGFFDVIKFTELFAQRTLFLRFAIRLSEPLDDKNIPFYQLSELGDDETIRGFKRGRFRDFDAVLGQAEYRYPIWRTIDALLFVDAGQVQQDVFRDFNTSDMQITYGGGFRFWKRDGTLIRLEVGKSQDGVRLLFLLNPAGERRTFAYF